MLCQWGYDRAQVAALGATCHVAVTRRYPLAVSTWSQFESLAPSPSWLPMGGLDPKVCPPGVRPPGPGGNGPGEASATGPWETLQGLGCPCVPLAPEPVPGAYQGERGPCSQGHPSHLLAQGEGQESPAGIRAWPAGMGWRPSQQLPTRQVPALLAPPRRCRPRSPEPPSRGRRAEPAQGRLSHGQPEGGTAVSAATGGRAVTVNQSPLLGRPGAMWLRCACCRSACT